MTLEIVRMASSNQGKQGKTLQISLRVTERFRHLVTAMAERENRSVANMLDEIVKRAAAQAGVSVPETDAKPARKKAAKKTTKKAAKKG